MARPIKEPTIVKGVKCWHCSTCNKLLPASGYYKLKSAANGLRSLCKHCHTASNLSTRDIENHRSNMRRYYLESKGATV